MNKGLQSKTKSSEGLTNEVHDLKYLCVEAIREIDDQMTRLRFTRRVMGEVTLSSLTQLSEEINGYRQAPES